MELSAPERRLVDFASGRFGEPLTQFLLAGLGEVRLSQRRGFTITYVGSEGQYLRRRVQVLTHEQEDGPTLLPSLRDPLVLLALLRLLPEDDQKSRYSLSYGLGDILRLLDWRDTRKARGEVDEAVERYSLLTYIWEIDSAELAHRNLSIYKTRESMISQFQTIDHEDERASNLVVFNPHFIENLERRSLFGVDWDRVQSLGSDIVR